MPVLTVKSKAQEHTSSSRTQEAELGLLGVQEVSLGYRARSGPKASKTRALGAALKGACAGSPT